MSRRKLYARFLLLSLLGGPAAAVAEPLYGLTCLPQDFYATGINGAGHSGADAASPCLRYTWTMTLIACVSAARANTS